MQNGITFINYEQTVNTNDRDVFSDGVDHGYFEAVEDILNMLCKEEKNAFEFGQIKDARLYIDIRSKIYDIVGKR